MQLKKKYRFPFTWKEYLQLDDNDRLTSIHYYRTANFDTFSTRLNIEDTNLEEWLKTHNIRYGNHTIYVFGDIAIKNTDNRVLIGKSEDVYEGGWG
jgi:hypothetical protein